ncbi:ADP-ribosylation [Irpex lacteus]|nr:ADP-ribosylation [Irpex lacteus]
MLNSGLSDYCSRKCGQESLKLAPAIFSINNNYETFKDVSKQFIDQWKHQTRIPNVLKVWRIIGLKTLHDDFSRYKLSIERSRNLAGGNSKRRWHGTIRACRLGDDESQKTLCVNLGCSLCRIIETSFRVAQSGKRTNYGRFGQGIYTSATSSKANDYVDEQGMSPYKCMLLNDVILGNAKKLYTDQPNLTQPPTGYDSVIGEPGHSLNYDEAIGMHHDILWNGAIRPLFLVIYQ